MFVGQHLRVMIPLPLLCPELLQAYTSRTLRRRPSQRKVHPKYPLRLGSKLLF
jgi:hypothetical protein